MHKIEIPPDVLARIKERRGSFRMYETLDPKRTAHIVVDLQNGFMAPGAICEIETAREIVPNVNAISAALRAAGGLVVYVQNTFDDVAVKSWGAYFDDFCSRERRAGMIAAFTPGASGHDLYPDLEVLPGDLKIHKRRYGAFVPGSSDLHAALQPRGIDTLIITGTATNVCCESTARDGMMMNYKVLFVADANATHTDVEHNATLAILARSFADVATTDEVVASIRQGVAMPQAAE